jgi:hypothetical protein
VSDDAELLSAISDLREVEAELARLEAERLVVRARIAHLVAARHGGRVRVPGFGSLAIRPHGTSERWDTGALAELVQSLRETGHAELAEEIAACKKTVNTPSGLTITPERPRDL